MVPSFQDFVNSFSQEKLDYDLRRFGGEKLNKMRNPFSSEQCHFLMQSITTAVCAFMVQYHEWLEENLERDQE